MGKGEFYELPQGDAPTYDQLVTENDLDTAREQLGPTATPAQLSLRAESIAERRRPFEQTYGLQE